MSEIEWADPPALVNRTDWAAIATALRSRPGQWAKVKTGTSSQVAAAIKSGQYRAFQPAGSFEARTSKTATGTDGQSDIYARFVGEGGAA
jgi:hypothetical protein